MTYDADEVIPGCWSVDPVAPHPGAAVYDAVANPPPEPTIEESA